MLAASHHLLIGDESALPAIETILESLPETARASVIAEVADVQEERPLGGKASGEIVWLHRRADNAANGSAIEAALRRIVPPAPDTRVYVACEATAMRRIRQLLIGELGLPRSQVVGRGYWKQGAVNHPDSDYGDEA